MVNVRCQSERLGQMKKKVKAHHSFIRSLCVWNNCLCSASADSTIKVWRADLECLAILFEHAKSVRYCVLDKLYLNSRSIFVYQDWLVSGAIDGSIKVCFCLLC